MDEHHTHHLSHKEESPYDVKTLLSWDGPGRPYKKRTRSYFASVLLIAILVEIILFLFSQYALMVVVASLVFLAFALAVSPPRDFHYRISTEGVMVEDHFFIWKELYDFYFKKKSGQDVLHIRTVSMYPGEVTATLGNISEEHLKKVLLPYLPYREYITPTFMEKSADWLTKNFPLEKE
ncbi:MAG TPA: hypothetical protein VF189_01485 [Patescibacteria group bacterium]